MLNYDQRLQNKFNGFTNLFWDYGSGLNLFFILKTLLVNTKCKQNTPVITSIKKEFLKIETLLINNVCIYLNPKAFTTTTTPTGIGIIKIKTFTI